MSSVKQNHSLPSLPLLSTVRLDPKWIGLIKGPGYSHLKYIVTQVVQHEPPRIQLSIWLDKAGFQISAHGASPSHLRTLHQRVIALMYEIVRSSPRAKTSEHIWINPRDIPLFIGTTGRNIRALKRYIGRGCQIEKADPSQDGLYEISAWSRDAVTEARIEILRLLSRHESAYNIRKIWLDNPYRPRTLPHQSPIARMAKKESYEERPRHPYSFLEDGCCGEFM